METIFCNVTKEIKVPNPDDRNIIWEIDNDENLDYKITLLGIEITANSNAISTPDRILKYYYEGLEEEEHEINIVISKQETIESGLQLPTAVNQSNVESSNTLQKKMKVFEDEEIFISGSKNYLNFNWSFSNRKNDAYVKVKNEGVFICNLPVGFYTLQCQSDTETHEIEIRSLRRKKNEQPITKNFEPIKTPVQKSQSSKKENITREKLVNEIPKVKVKPDEEDNPQKDWPKTTEDVVLEISSNGRVYNTFPVKKTESLLIGKESRSKKVVDIDLSEYTQNTQSISRNHLKIWQNDDYLMMKNIGSHRVKYQGQEMLSQQIAVLKKGGVIEIADLIITIVEV